MSGLPPGRTGIETESISSVTPSKAQSGLPPGRTGSRSGSVCTVQTRPANPLGPNHIITVQLRRIYAYTSHRHDRALE